MPFALKHQYTVSHPFTAQCFSICPSKALILTSPGMRRGWQTAPYTSHNVWKNLKESTKCPQLRLTLSICVLLLYRDINLILRSWNNTDSCWVTHHTMTVHITSSNHSVLSALCWCYTVGVDSSWQRFSSESVYHLYLCREQWLKATGVHCRLSDLSMFCSSVHRIAGFHAVIS